MYPSISSIASSRSHSFLAVIIFCLYWSKSFLLRAMFSSVRNSFAINASSSLPLPVTNLSRLSRIHDASNFIPFASIVLPADAINEYSDLSLSSCSATLMLGSLIRIPIPSPVRRVVILFAFIWGMFLARSWWSSHLLFKIFLTTSGL